jgi:hypothetical protein
MSVEVPKEPSLSGLHNDQGRRKLQRFHKRKKCRGCLELAMRRDLPLASLDDDLKAAAAAVGVGEYKP